MVAGKEVRPNWWRAHRLDLICLMVVSAGIGLAFCFAPADSMDHLLFLGDPLYSSCTLQSTFNLPCWACGMTRAFAYGVRFRLVEAWSFNPAGTLFLGYMVGHGVYRCWTLLGGKRLGFGLQVFTFLAIVAFMFVRWVMVIVMPAWT